MPNHKIRRTTRLSNESEPIFTGARHTVAEKENAFDFCCGWNYIDVSVINENTLVEQTMFRFSFRMTFLGYIQAIVLFIGVVSPRGLWADFTIKIDYSLDTNNFFNTQARKDALQAVTNP